MTRCARCEWRPTTGGDIDRGKTTAEVTPAEQLRAHALDWQHPLCCICARSLPDTHPQTCETCIGRAQADLAGILLMWTELPHELGHAKAAPLDRDGRGGSEEHALPGGTVFALLAPGSAGNVLPRSGNSEHLEDNRADSTPSIAWTLTTWEDDWRRTFGHQSAQDTGSTASTVRAAAGYLERHTRWAADRHGAFAEYAGDLRELHARLEQATGRVRRPVKAGADCFDCGGALVRPVSDDGLEVEDVVTCRQCGSTYDGARYLLALAARRQEGLDGWVAVPAAALASRRPVKTLRAWLGTVVPVACDVASRAQVVWYPALAERAEKAQKRRRMSA